MKVTDKTGYSISTKTEPSQDGKADMRTGSSKRPEEMGFFERRRYAGDVRDLDGLKKQLERDYMLNTPTNMRSLDSIRARLGDPNEKISRLIREFRSDLKSKEEERAKSKAAFDRISSAVFAKNLPIDSKSDPQTTHLALTKEKNPATNSDIQFYAKLVLHRALREGIIGSTAVDEMKNFYSETLLALCRVIGSPTPDGKGERTPIDIANLNPRTEIVVNHRAKEALNLTVQNFFSLPDHANLRENELELRTSELTKIADAIKSFEGIQINKNDLTSPINNIRLALDKYLFGAERTPADPIEAAERRSSHLADLPSTARARSFTQFAGLFAYCATQMDSAKAEASARRTAALISPLVTEGWVQAQADATTAKREGKVAGSAMGPDLPTEGPWKRVAQALATAKHGLTLSDPLGPEVSPSLLDVTKQYIDTHGLDAVQSEMARREILEDFVNRLPLKEASKLDS